MAKHAKPTKVRLWPDGYLKPSVDALVDDWDNGNFSLPHDHPMAQLAWELVGKSRFTVTVLESEQLEWHIAAMDTADRNHCRTQVRCIPKIVDIRRGLEWDEWAAKNLETSWSSKEWGQK